MLDPNGAFERRNKVYEDVAHQRTANEYVLQSVPQAPELPYSCDSANDPHDSFYGCILL